MKDSGGCIDIVTDEQILEAQRWLASEEGIFVEPASAASVAGLMKCFSGERCVACPFHSLPEGAKVVLTVTGHGLKDPEAPMVHGFKALEAETTMEGVAGVLGVD